MLTDQVRNDIDCLWEQLRNDGLVNNLTVLEQISYLLFVRMIDMQEEALEKNAVTSDGGFFTQDSDGQSLRWKNFKDFSDTDLYIHLKEKVYPYFADLGSKSIHSRELGQQSIESLEFLGQMESLGSISEYIVDASLEVRSPTVLVAAVKIVDSLPLNQADIKGDIYEYLLSKLTIAGINGQFLTPRHIIDAMVEMVDPKPTDIICDPACGTGGFLARTVEYLNRIYSSEAGTCQGGDGDKACSGDLLEPHRQHINSQMFWGFDIDSTMVRFSSMNMMLHGVSGANIFPLDSLGQSIKTSHPQQEHEFFDVMLAHPPFGVNLDESKINPDLFRMVKSKRTELLFVAHTLRALKPSGRAAVIVPNALLSGTSNAHLQIRKELIENNQLQGVLSLPAGVFQPITGIQTAILFFVKGGSTEHVWFYDLQADGYSLDNKRMPFKDADSNDLSDAIGQWKQYQKLLKASASSGEIEQVFGDKTKKAFVVDASEIISNGYDLSINRYKKEIFEEEVYKNPKVILQQLMSLEKEIMDDLKALENML